MPFPGTTVAQSNNFTGDIQQIAPEFIENVKELVTGLFAPNKLKVKKINGDNMRVRDLIKYLEAYLDIFNGDALPEPKSVFMVCLLLLIIISFIFGIIEKWTNFFVIGHGWNQHANIAGRLCSRLCWLNAKATEWAKSSLLLWRSGSNPPESKRGSSRTGWMIYSLILLILF